MRPRLLAELVGQAHLFGPNKLLADAIASDHVPSMILWGPPGVGKTTLGRIIAEQTKAEFVPFSAVLGNLQDLRAIVQLAKERRDFQGKRTLVFVDEIHRFNKAQQDAFLPQVENGTITLVGATTENPSFAVNAALLSRCKALSTLEALAEHMRTTDQARLTLAMVASAEEHAPLLYDKSGEEHYNVVSAFIKSMRGSDPDAAVYWMMRMLQAGDDPLFVLRRMLIFASEDIGNADSRALLVAVAADQSFRRMGMPEGLYPLAHAAVYLACAPKSNAVNAAWHRAKALVEERGSLPVPKKLRNAVTPLMRDEGYGAGYKYAHDFEGGVVAGETYLPDDLVGETLYEPTERGEEARIKARLLALRGQGDRKPE